MSYFADLDHIAIAKLQAVSAIRRLWPQRHSERVGADAIEALRFWIKRARAIKSAE